jgi:hypothetical protein
MTHQQKNNMYYKIIVSSIYTAQNNGVMSDIWKIASNFYVAVAISGNVMILYILLNNMLFPHCLEFLNIKIVTSFKHNFTLNLIIYTWIPFMILNYFLVYRKNKYKQLIKDYKLFYNKKLFAFYFSISILLPIIYVFIQKK